MMRRFAVLTLVAVMLGVAPAAFAQGSGDSGGGSGGSSNGSGPGGPVTPGAPSTPGMGNQAPPPAGGAIQNSPGRSSNQTTPGTTGESRTTGPIDSTAQATTALQAHGYSNVQGLVRTGDVFRGRALRDGRTVMIEMDARTGVVRETSG